MEVAAGSGETEVPVTFTMGDDGTVKITMSGKFKTVELKKDEAETLAKFLSPEFGYNQRGADA
jgi:hypothetical protein